MQSKISSFFKPPSSSSSTTKSTHNPHPIFDDGDHELALWENTQHQFVNAYKRRAPKSDDGYAIFFKLIFFLLMVFCFECWVFDCLICTPIWFDLGFVWLMRKLRKLKEKLASENL
jgi:hypothetical protein